MTRLAKPVLGASSSKSTKWHSIDWHKARHFVKRLQMRIAKAAKEGRHGKVKALQWLLTHSFYAKALAVKRVTENRGKFTPGVDSVVCSKAIDKMKLALSLTRRGYQAKPLRRVYIPKKNGKQRPLGIPTMSDRAMQALYLQALEPISEVTADPNSYGFRPWRCAGDAIEQCFRVLCHKPSAQWILEGDIKQCFDQIRHDWLVQHIPMDKSILQKWLESGYVDRGKYYNTRAGTPQGGVASPTLANMALDGLEQAAKKAARAKDKVHVVRYADDFIITADSKEILEDKVKPVVAAFLEKRGLLLSEEKTRITHINDGFDFLGFNVRKYQGKLLIKPAKKSVQVFLDKIRATVKSCWGVSVEHMIRRLNPMIRGWANYYRHVVSKQVFHMVDNEIYLAVAKWVKRRHPKKNVSWWRKRYYRSMRGRNWIFTATPKEIANAFTPLDLFKCQTIPIHRHCKLPAAATPYDTQYQEYYRKRIRKKQQCVYEAAYIRLAAG